MGSYDRRNSATVCRCAIIDDIRLVPGNRSAFLFKDILTESEMAHVLQSMPQGEKLHYGLVLCNVYKRGIQKVEFTIKKK
jgi:hypothetical protein